MGALSMEHEDGVGAGTSLDLGAGPLIGRVARLDRHGIGIHMFKPDLVARVTVFNLVAISAGDEYMIGLVDGVTVLPHGEESVLDHGSEQAAAEVLAEVQLQAIGSFRPQAGSAGWFTRGASVYPRMGADCHLIDGERLTRFLGVLAEEVDPEERLVLGRYVGARDAIAVADGNRLFQRHVALLGSTGAGKSWTVSLILERAARLDHANIIVFDMHGEYTPLTKYRDDAAPVARGLRLAGPADLGHADPNLLYLPYWLLRRDELMTLVLNPNDPYGPEQVLRFTEHVQTLKQIALIDAGRDDAVTRFTVDSPLPYRLESLIQMLTNDNTEKIPQHPSNRLDPGPYFGQMTGFISRLEARAADPRYGFIFDPPEQVLDYGWLTETAATLLQSGAGGTGIKIIDLSEVPRTVLPIVVGVLARFVFDVQFWMDPEERVPITLVCDEAHLYLPAGSDTLPTHRAALGAFESIAKEGRKYGVGLMVASQRPTDVSPTVLSQCNNFIVMRISDDRDQAVIERLLPETVPGIKGVLPILDVGEGVVIGDATLLTSRVKFDPPEVRPSSATQPYWTIWTEQPSSRNAIDAGVEALRNQLRPD